MNKETGDSNAPFLGLPEGLHVKPHAPMHYGKTPVPHPCNHAAEKVNPRAIVDSFTKRM